jgi:membrane protein
MGETRADETLPMRGPPVPVRDRNHTRRIPERDDEAKRRLGRHATNPAQIPWAGWKRVIIRAGQGVISDRVSLAAAGCAFYAVLAMFPTITMLVALYGLLFDPHSVEAQLAMLRPILPHPTLLLISDRVHDLVSKPSGTLTFSFVVSLLITLWSASAGTKSVLSALNIAYDEIETRSFLRYQATALAMTLCAILGAGLAVALIVALPPILTYVPQHLGLTELADRVTGWIKLGSFLLMLGFVVGALSVLYRFGPNRRPARWHWVSPGSLLATALWLLASVGFSYYVGHIASYDATYGPLGAIVGMMMWFYVTAFVVLAGAELNAELELQTAEDSTAGGIQPIGERGAYVADHVARD